MSTNNYNPTQVGQQRGVIDWGKVQALLVQFHVEYHTPNGIIRLVWGWLGNNKHIGIRIEDLALKGEVYRDSLTIIDLNKTLVGDQVYKAMVVSDGQGNAEWFLDSGSGLVSVGSSTLAPTGTSTGADMVGIKSENGVDAARQDVRVSSCKLYVGQ